VKANDASREEIMKAFTGHTPHLGGQFFAAAQTLFQIAVPSPRSHRRPQKEIIMKNWIAAAFVASALSLGVVHAQNFDPSTQYGSVTVPAFDSADTQIVIPASNFVSFGQQIDYNFDESSLGAQFKVLNIAAPSGLSLSMNDIDDDGLISKLTRDANGDLALCMDLTVTADGVAPGAYPVVITLQNTETGAQRTFTVQVVVD
jgi:hypothetical protein